MSDRYDFYERRWLNEKHGRAYSITSINLLPSSDWTDVEVEIGDCSKSVILDLSYSLQDKDFDKQLRKLDRFIESLTKLRKAMIKTKRKKRISVSEKSAT